MEQRKIQTAALSAQTLILALMCSFTWPSAAGAATNTPASESPAQEIAAPTGQATRFHLSGVLISQSGRAALINGRILSEGEHVGSAKIVAINEGVVRLRTVSRVVDVRVGSSMPIARLSRITETEVSASNRHVPTATSDTAALTAVTVRPGDTLSGIAERYTDGTVTPNQMMIALFRKNPHAFGDNINVLRAGVTLRMPDSGSAHHYPAQDATAEVVRQTREWQALLDGREPDRKLARTVERIEYGPVDNGETLSAIAAGLLTDDVTLDQMMIALFEVNPQAFNGNIHVLYEGTVLRVPSKTELRRQAPESATAEVNRHTVAWQVNAQRQARSADVRPSLSTVSPVPLQASLQRPGLVK